MAEQSRVTIELEGLQTNIQVSGNCTYIGKAPCGVLTSETKWQIKRIDATTGTLIQWASGDQVFDKEFDERATYTYS